MWKASAICATWSFAAERFPLSIYIPPAQPRRRCYICSHHRSRIRCKQGVQWLYSLFLVGVFAVLVMKRPNL